VFCKYTKKEASNPRKVTDFLKNYSLRDNLVSEDYQASCFVLQIYKKVILLAQNYLMVYDLSTYFIKEILYEK